MLSLFLLWPTGSSLGMVLAVLGTGIWMGVQHLGYLEFGELARVAQRTLDQPQIFVNNLAIRRAVKELKVARDYEHVRKILVAAFGSNDFDAFELELPLSTAEMGSLEADYSDGSGGPSFRWSKPGVPQTHSSSTAWRVALHLLTSNGIPCGTLTVLRLYSERDLQIDINLLTASFPTALADALHRTLTHPAQLVDLHAHAGTLLEAQAG
jgi:hypothetical protein